MDEPISLDDLRAITDPAQQAKRATQLVSYHQEIANEASRIRRDALGELVARDWSHSAMAELLGTSRTRVGQLLTTGPQAERALLGTATLTVAIGSKVEPAKTTPSAVVSAEALAAYDLIRVLAADYGLDTTYELVPPPGMVQLNRANLVVLTSPRLLPLVGQVLESDPHLAFASGGQGWYLKDHTTGAMYRSPSNAGEPTDYAYIGRLPRPDGKGSFLYLAGIHAMGTVGAAHFLSANIEDLYRTVKNRRWSTLVACHYDPDTREVTATERLTDIYTP